MQIEDVSVVEVQTLMIIIEEIVPRFDDGVKRKVFLRVLNHRVSILERISQQAHSMFISLQNVEHLCNEELLWRNPIFK